MAELPVLIMQNKCDAPAHAGIPSGDAIVQWSGSNGECPLTHFNLRVLYLCFFDHCSLAPGFIGVIETSAKDHTHPGIADAVAVLVHCVIAKGISAAAAVSSAGVVQLSAAAESSSSCC